MNKLITRKLSLVIQKGGSGKTTNTLNIADTVSLKNKKILIVDMDHQGSLTKWYGLTPFDSTNTIYNLLDGDKITVNTVNENTDIIKASFKLAELDSGEVPLDFLSKALEQFDGLYDYIIIDTPPSVANLTKMAIYASDKCFIPVQATPVAFEGIDAILKAVEEVDKLDGKSRLGGIFLCCTFANQNLTKIIKEGLTEKYQPLNLSSNIRHSVHAQESKWANQSVVRYKPDSLVRWDFEKLTDEILTIVNK